MTQTTEIFGQSRFLAKVCVRPALVSDSTAWVRLNAAFSSSVPQCKSAGEDSATPGGGRSRLGVAGLGIPGKLVEASRGGREPRRRSEFLSW